MDRGEGVIEIRVHVVDRALEGMIYDLEIFFKEQVPPWQAAYPLQWPTGWSPMDMVGGIGFATATNPLRYCEPVTFVIQVVPPVTGDHIWIHATDKDHNNLGYIVSQRAPS